MLPLLQPEPADGLITGGGANLAVTFSLPLKPDLLDIDNWTWRYGGSLFTCDTAAAAGNLVTLTGHVEGAELGANVCHYAPPPWDVEATPAAGGQGALAFTNFPIHA